jgi:hypothetical protein
MSGKGKKRSDTFGTDWGTAFDSPEFGGSGSSVRHSGDPGRSRSQRKKGGTGSGRGSGVHKGDYTYPVHGWLDGLPVTASFGWGSKEGHTLLADGHIDRATFRNHGNHNHYGPGDGPNNNVFDRLKYTGPGA